MPLRTLFRHLLKYFLSESLSDNFLVLKKLLNLYFKFFDVDFILHDVQGVIMSNAHTARCKISALLKNLINFDLFCLCFILNFFLVHLLYLCFLFLIYPKYFLTCVCFLLLFSSFHKLPPFSRFLITFFYQVIIHIYEDSYCFYFLNK